MGIVRVPHVRLKIARPAPRALRVTVRGRRAHLMTVPVRRERTVIVHARHAPMAIVRALRVGIVRLVTSRVVNAASATHPVGLGNALVAVQDRIATGIVR